MVMVDRQRSSELTLGNILEALVGSHDCDFVMKTLDLKAEPGI